MASIENVEQPVASVGDTPIPYNPSDVPDIKVLMGEEQGDVPLEALVGQSLVRSVPPEASLKNQSAILALLSEDPATATQTYQLLVKEAQDGNNSTAQQLKQSIAQSAKQLDLKGAMSILSDKTIPLEQKQAAISALSNSQLKVDSAEELQARSLSAESKGENRQNENARLSTADSINNVNMARRERSRIVNANNQKFYKNSTGEAAFDVLMSFIPFASTAATASVTNQFMENQGTPLSKWQKVLSFFTPGSSKKTISDQLSNIPPEKRAAFMQNLVDAVESSDSFILGNDNSYDKFSKINEMIAENNFTATDEFIDNAVVVLDTIDVAGLLKLGTMAVRGVKGAGKTIATSEAKVLDIPAIESSYINDPIREIIEQVKTLPTGTTNDAARFKAIKELEDQKAALLGDAANLAEPGDVAQMRREIEEADARRMPTTDAELREAFKELQRQGDLKYKDAVKEVKKRVQANNADVDATITRLNNQIEANRTAAQAVKSIESIDTLIDTLKRGMGDTPGPLKVMSDQISRIFNNSFIRKEHPSSPAKIVQQTNPDQARNLHATTVLDISDEAAQALYGTSKTDAIVGDIFPQIGTTSGKVTTKVNDIQQKLRTPDNLVQVLRDEINNSGATYFSRREKEIARGVIHNDFASAEGLAINDAMSSFVVDGNQVYVNAIYGMPEGSFSNAEVAFNQAKFALRKQGVMENEITLYAKEGLDHVPVKLEDVKDIEGNYLVGVKTNVEMFSKDVGEMERFTVKRNFFDRMAPLVSETRGSASRWLFDAASMLPRIISGPASVASDASARFEKLLVSEASKFSDRFVKLSKPEQKLFDNYIREANYNSLPMDITDLQSRGFSPEGIETVKAWRSFWDGHFYLENYDVLRSLSGNGYEVFDSNGTKLFAKPAAKNSNIGTMYDPATDSIVSLTQTELDDLYNSGGTLAKLRRPTVIGESETEHMIVRNTPTEYLRRIRDTDQALNYREGYFQLQYTAPKFIEEITRNSAGTIIKRRAVAVAGDTAEAEAFKNSRQLSTGIEHAVRPDNRMMKKDDDAYWDVTSAGGRIAQRVRGKMLEDASGLNHLGDGSYILNPIDSARRAAQSIAGRTVTRPMLDASKARVLAQFKDLAPLDRFGVPRWPTNKAEIAMGGDTFSKETADFRTAYEYLNYLENGYINTADVVFKAFFNSMADVVGKAGMSKTERALMSTGSISPTGFIKGSVFGAYIASNPLRQLVLQPNQGLRTVAYNPQGWISGNIPKLMSEYFQLSAFPNSSVSKAGRAFKEYVDGSGMMSAVDKNNLVRGTLLAAADQSNMVHRAAKTPVEVLRKLGFDTGEMANLTVHHAAVYDRALRKGIDLTNKTLRDESYDQIRSITQNMNFAGDMVYNQTTPSVLLQFFQVPHKFLLQTTDRRISIGDKMRLVGADIVLWGTPVAAIGALLGKDMLPEDKSTRDLITDGLEAWAFNHMFSIIEGREVDIDFSSMAPYDLTGWKKFAEAMLTGGGLSVMTNSPAGSLYLKDGSKVQTAVQTIGRYFNAFEEVGQEKTEFLDMLKDVANISSGWSNAAKARLMLETGKKLDAYGAMTDEDVSKYEAFAQALGFGTKDTRNLYEVSKQLSSDSKEYRDDVIKSYQDVKRYYANKYNQELTSDMGYLRVTGWALQAYKNDPIALGIIQQQLQMDFQDPEQKLVEMIMKSISLPTLKNTRDQILIAPIPEIQKQQLLQMVSDFENVRQLNTDKE